MRYRYPILCRALLAGAVLGIQQSYSQEIEPGQLGSACHAMTTPGYSSSEYGQQYQKKYQVSFDPTSSFSISDLIKANEKSKTIEEVLKNTKKKFPELFDFPAIETLSRSPHGASAAHPRVVLMKNRLLMAYNTDPSDPDYKKIDIMDLDRDLSHASPGMAPSYRVMTATEENGKIIWNSDPKTCASCHSNRPEDHRFIRPLWDQYNVWPRFLGSRTGPYEHPEMTKMAVDFQTFLKEVPKNPRLNILNLNTLKKPDPLYGKLNKHLKDIIPSETGNFIISNEVYYWAIERLAYAVKSHPDFEKFKYPLMIISEAFDRKFDQNEDSKALQELLGPDLYQEWERRTQALSREFLNAYNRDAEFMYESKVYFTGEKPERDFRNSNEDIVKGDARIAAILTFMDIDLLDYSPQMTRGAPLFNGGESGQLEDIAYSLFGFKHGTRTTDERLTQEEAIKNIHAFKEQGSGKLKDYSWKPLKEKHLSAMQLFQSDCSMCHREQNIYGAPFIPFGDKIEFQSALTPELRTKVLNRLRTKDLAKRMPYFYTPFSEDEIQEVQNFMEELLNAKSGAQACQPKSSSESFIEILNRANSQR